MSDRQVWLLDWQALWSNLAGRTCGWQHCLQLPVSQAHIYVYASGGFAGLLLQDQATPAAACQGCPPVAGSVNVGVCEPQPAVGGGERARLGGRAARRQVLHVEPLVAADRRGKGEPAKKSFVHAALWYTERQSQSECCTSAGVASAVGAQYRCKAGTLVLHKGTAKAGLTQSWRSRRRPGPARSRLRHTPAGLAGLGTAGGSAEAGTPS